MSLRPSFLNPCSSAVTSYIPGTMPPTKYVPSAPLTVSRNMPVSWFLHDDRRARHGRALRVDDLASTSVVPCCANALAAHMSRPLSTRLNTRNFMMTVLPQHAVVAECGDR